MVQTRAAAAVLVGTICRLPGAGDFVQAANEVAVRGGLRSAVRQHNTAHLYDWLMDSFSFQGISDRIAWGYIEAHGNATWEAVERSLEGSRCQCPKLGSFETYRGCGFRKAAASCAVPLDLGSCPVPQVPLRKGDLNQLAYSLYYFLRDRCDGDLVGFLDRVFGSVAGGTPADRVAARRTALIKEVSAVHAVSAKLIAMSFANLLIAGDPRRRAWIEVGRSLVAIDTLVHNFLHRTGILQAYEANHLYGPRCYGPTGCAAILYDLADRIDARTIDPSFPASFPRLIQVAIWRFCAEGRTNFCNGRQIDDRFPCTRAHCPVGSRCARVPLRPTSGRDHPKPIPT
jgi:hypothetical protein